jgi:RecB family exonuclease
VVCSRSRRDAEGRINGASPLLPRDIPETYRQRARLPEHAAGASDRLFARPAEFQTSPMARKSLSCWTDWHSPQLTAHDGLMRPGHPIALRAMARRQSATSLSCLLRDPLGYLWRYGFGWNAPEETEEPIRLEPPVFGELLHETLESTVNRLEAGSGFASATRVDIERAVAASLEAIGKNWESSEPIPPPVIWRRKVEEVRTLAIAALTFAEEGFAGQRSWAEIPFGGDARAAELAPEVRARLPWDPMLPVLIPGTDIVIGGAIDRIDLSGDASAARVTDYKSGKPPNPKYPPALKQGGELQRCLYAYAATVLLPQLRTIEARLLYPRAEEDALFPLADAREVLRQLTEFVVAAQRAVHAGELLPGPGAAEDWNDMAFALPGSAKQSYFEMKQPLVADRLDALSPLWELP